MVKLKRLKIHQYRNIRPGTELHFDDGVNLVLGQNGAGKTTLLALISAACRSSFVEIESEEFDLEYDLICGLSLIRARATHRRQPVPTNVVTMEMTRLWEDNYSIAVEDETGKKLLHTTYDGDPKLARSKTPLILDWSFIAAALSMQSEPLATMRTELLTGAGSTYRFDESLDCFAAATGRPPTIKSPALPGLSYTSWRDARDPQGGTSVFEGTYTPGHFSNAIHHEFRRTGQRPGGLGDADKEFTAQVATALQVDAVSLEPNVKSWQKTASEQSYLIEGFTFWVTRFDGKRVHHDHLSYGQKRLLAFFYYLALNPSIVIADELVNGLHHRWIEACMNAIGERQAFLTSQNPLLFEYVRFESVEQVQTCFVTCKTELVDGAEQLVWQNMPREDAINFYRAYQADIEGVGDILINRGLW